MSSPTATTSQLRRNNCQRRSPNASPVLPSNQQRTRQNTTAILSTTTTTTTTAAVPVKSCRSGRDYLCFANNNSNTRSRQTLFGNHTNYYSSKIDRSIVNCEKFLPDQDLTNSTKENDLLLIHARQSARFV